MKRCHKIVATLACASVAASALAGCTLPRVEVADLLQDTTVADARAQRADALSPVVAPPDLHEEGTLVVGIKSSAPAPMAALGSDGELRGVDVDVAFALADKLGLSEARFVTVTDAASGLAGGCDVVMGATPDEPATVRVVAPYSHAALGVFSKDAQRQAPADATALAGRTVGVQAASASQAALAALDLDFEQRTYPNLNEAFDALASGEVEVVVCDAGSGAFLGRSHEGVSFLGCVNEPASRGIAVAAGSPLADAVSSAMSQLEADGIVGLVRGRWLGQLPELSDELLVTGLSPRATGDAAQAPDPAPES